jgi:2-polyprenyl-3-methyl-5-hydroxy-6-metoxy-1,4-benzoquinol methylase
MRSGSDFSVEHLVERMRAGARRAAGSALSVFDNGSNGARPASVITGETRPSHFAEIKSDLLNLQASFTPSPDDRYHVNDLLKYNDRNFLQNAYLAILKRGPDATGYAAFIDSLRSGRLNKLDVLARLRYSPEGRAKKVQIDGLFFPAAVRFSYQVPVVGYLLNLAVGLARLPKSIRHQQQFEAHVSAQQEQIADHANRRNAALTTLAAETTAVLDRLQQAALINAEQQSQHVAEMASRQQEIASRQQELAALLLEQTHDLQELKDEERQQAAAFIGRQERLENLIAAQQRDLESFVIAQQDRLAALAQEQRAYVEELDQAQQQRVASLAEEQKDRLAKSITELQQELAKTYTQLEHFQSLIDKQQHEGEANRILFREETTALETSIEKKSSERETKLELLAKELRSELARVFSKQQELRAELSLQAQRANVLLDKARQELAQPRERDYLTTMAREAEHTLDAFYLALEEQFRGSRAEIKKRLQVYLPLIVEAGVGRDDQPILDVGCGRGEWLELLAENDLRASGIDSNRMQVAKSLEFDLDVSEAELLTYLRSINDSSLGAVTGFHIVEHLPIETLVAFLDETVRVVKPGGVVIFETPNPENVLVGSCNFYFDPTHRNPLPAPVLKFLVESRGFQNVRVLKLNPSDEALVKGTSELTKRFNQYFYGPMDYAVVGWRP